MTNSRQIRKIVAKFVERANWLILMTFQVFARAWAGAIQAGSMLAVVTTVRGVLGCEALAVLMSAILRDIRGKGVRVRHGPFDGSHSLARRWGS
jgi:hypothetical protein